MPPSRRRPTPQPQPSSRRPRVAGLRRPAGPAKPGTESTEPAEIDESVESTATVEPVEPAATSAFVGELDQPDEVTEDEATEDIGDADDTDDTDDAADEEASDEEAEAEEAGEDEPAAATERRPRPSGKRRSSGLRAPTAKDDLVKAERRSQADRRPARTATKRSAADQLVHGRFTLAIVLVVVALVLAGLALFFRIQAVNAGDAADTGNTALTDTDATRQLVNELRPPIEAVFSIDYQHLDKTSQVATANLTAAARKQYDQLFGVVRDNAPKQKLVSTFKIREISVMSLRGDSAEVLVFADQTSNKPCDPRDDKIRTCAAAIGVPAQRVEGHWKIAGFDMFNGNPVG